MASQAFFYNAIFFPSPLRRISLAFPQISRRTSAVRGGKFPLPLLLGRSSTRGDAGDADVTYGMSGVLLAGRILFAARSRVGALAQGALM